MSTTGLRGFSHVLKDEFSSRDAVWSFTVPNLPRNAVATTAGLIKFVSISAVGETQRMTLQYVSCQPNRAIDYKQLHLYVQISFEKFKLWQGSTSLPLRESADYKARLLKHGITLNGTTYRFYGHSNSQLKNSTCYLYAGTAEDISAIVEAFGDFTSIKTVAKKAKRIGLLFSAASVATTLDPARCRDIADINSGDYLHTDGCGLISPQLARLLVQKADIRFRGLRFVPSVYQIRYRGYKGVLTLEPTLPKGELAHFRDSMRKFKGGSDLSFAVVDFARPYAFGYLNDEVILLLHALGVPLETFLRKQCEHIQFLHQTTSNPLDAFRFLSYLNETKLAERVLIDGLEKVTPRITRLVKGELGKMTNKKGETKSRILIPQSRLIFGICDPRNVLKPGECAVRVTMAGDGVAKTIVGTEVLVTRNPCLHPGDLQKFKAVEHQELSHLVDCIVFPVKGKRPSADLMSGGDLDGDKFLVCWDPDIIPSVLAEPAKYVGPREPVTFGPITYDDRLKYFASYTNASLGRVKNLYLDWARSKGPMCAECQELNYLFSNCVDGNRIRVPAHLTKTPESAGPGPFVLDALHAAASELIRCAPTRLAGASLDVVQLLLSHREVAMSEFELFKIALQWCRESDHCILELVDLFDFNQLTDIQRAWVVDNTPAVESQASQVLNAMLSSSILDRNELRTFRLDLVGIRWKRTFSSDTDRLGTFLQHMDRIMDLFERKLIVLQIDNRLSVALYVPRRLPSRQESVVDDTCRLFAFPHSQGDGNQHRRVVPTRAGYRLSYSETGLQLYQTQKRDTWVFITKPGSNDASYRAIEDRGDRRRQRQATIDSGENADCIASIALGKFSSAIARQIGRVNRTSILAAEIYVISNRDVRSLQLLDQWIHFVDTQETLPLFEKALQEYRLPVLKDIDWSQQPSIIVDVVKSERFPALLNAGLEDVSMVLDWLVSHEQVGLLCRIFKFIFSEPSHLSIGILRPMIKTIQQVPSIVLQVAKIQDWDTLPVEVASYLRENAELFLSGVVLCANEMQGLAAKPFENIIAQCQTLDLSSYLRLVELISLAVELPEVVLDLLVGIVDRESPRLFVQRPSLVRYVMKNSIGIAMEHIEEARESRAYRKDLFHLRFSKERRIVVARVRIDAHSTVALATGDHVCLEAAQTAQNSYRISPYTMHALVDRCQPDSVSFELVHPAPSYLEQTEWRLRNCGSFVTTRAMFEALSRFVISPDLFCGIQGLLLGGPYTVPPKTQHLGRYTSRLDLNAAQNGAVDALLTTVLTCLWGPPGTGKTHTLAAALEELLVNAGDDKILVSAPTHNAVDNLLRAFLANVSRRRVPLPNVLRVSTNVRRVASDLRKYTCDAMAGKDLNEHPEARRKAQQQVDKAQVVFTTCAGASLGLLRGSAFPIVIIDEASQQTEPQSLIPLCKGCKKAVLVGDHVQLRATVHPHAQLQGYDVSLFERLYNDARLSQYPPSQVQRVMLDVQYRMHRSICTFSSQEFYGGRLKTEVADSHRPLPNTLRWPLAADGSVARLLFVQCDHSEDLGGRSKNNKGQVALARSLCDKLLPASTGDGDLSGQVCTIAALTPYTACVKELQSSLPSAVQISSIDGFQGREADIVIFVTTRCNLAGEIGFLRDMRRLNVVLTRAKSALIVIGDKETLTKQQRASEGEADVDPELKKAKEVWSRMISTATELTLDDTVSVES